MNHRYVLFIEDLGYFLQHLSHFFIFGLKLLSEVHFTLANLDPHYKCSMAISQRFELGWCQLKLFSFLHFFFNLFHLLPGVHDVIGVFPSGGTSFALRNCFRNFLVDTFAIVQNFEVSLHLSGKWVFGQFIMNCVGSMVLLGLNLSIVYGADLVRTCSGIIFNIGVKKQVNGV